MYKINPNQYGSMFMVPTEVSDKWLKLSGATQLKVLLCALRNNGNMIDEQKIAKMLKLSLDDTIDALNYWQEAGILTSENDKNEVKVPKNDQPKPKIIQKEVQKPSREEIAIRGNESKEIALLLREAQMKFGRTLRHNEASTFVWLHDSEGMDVTLILLLISFAVSEGKTTASFIEKTANKWLDDGVTSIADAEKYINNYNLKKSAWSTVRTAFSIDSRKPSTKESEYSLKWIDEFGFDKKMLKEAYNICVDNTSKISFSYINKILEAWYKNGIKTTSDIEKQKEIDKTKNNKNGMATYDVDKFLEDLYKIP